MESPDPIRAADSSPSKVSSRDNPQPIQSREPAHHPISLVPLLTLALVLAVIVAMVVWLVEESGVFHFQPAKEQLVMMGTPYEGSSQHGKEVAFIKSVSAIFGLYGGLLGVALGLAGAITRRSARAAIWAGGIGLILGAIAGALPPWLVLPPYFAAEGRFPGELRGSILMHCELWTALGAAAGLALGISLGDRKRWITALIGGLLGAVLGTVFFDFVGSLAFPLAETGRPVSATWGTRLLARLLVAAFVAAGAVIVASADRPARPEASAR